MKKNGFWIALSAGAGVAVIAFAALVLPKWAEESDKKTAVKSQHESRINLIAQGGKGVPTAAWNSEIKTHNEALNKEFDSLRGHFQAADGALEKWFDDKEPLKGVLVSRASTEILNMLKTLRAKMGEVNVPADGKALFGETSILGFEFPNSDGVQDTPEDKRRWQKIFNIHARMCECMLESNVQRFYKVQFSQQMNYPAEMAALMGKERLIENGLGAYIPFALDCSMLWKDIPKLFAAILKYDAAKPTPMFRIAMVRVERDEKFRIMSTIEEDVEEAEFNEKTWKPKTVVKEDPVRVQVLIEAYDFDFKTAPAK